MPKTRKVAAKPSVPSYKVTDKRGKEYPRNDKRATGGFNQPARASNLYPSPQRNLTTSFRPRYYTVSDTSQGFTNWDRMNLIRYGRDIFASAPNLNGAVRQKASFSVLDSFAPRFKGQDSKWGSIVEDWLSHSFFPVGNVRGGNYNFNNSLYSLSCALDIDGDSLIYLTQSRNGFPQFGIVPAHRIGDRQGGTNAIVKDGKYKGNKIIDGVIVNDDMRPIAYRILGDTEDEDKDIPAQSALLLFEPQWSDSVRGISNFGSIVIDMLNAVDIEYYLQQGVKLDSSVGLLSYTESGGADVREVFNPILGEDSNPLLPNLLENTSATGTGANANHDLAVEPIMGGLVNYFKAGTGERLESFKSDRPTQNVEAFMTRLERRCLYGLGWNYELLNPKEIGGASVRLIQAEARNAIKMRQRTLARAAKFIVSYAVAKGMQNKLIPSNNDDWFKWGFSTGELLSVDNGYERSANQKDLAQGIKTLQDVVEAQGHEWEVVRNQREIEVRDLLTRAQKISKDYNLPISAALSLMQQQSPNESAALVIPEDK